MKLTGIITGDVVASSSLGPKSREKLFADLKKFLRSLKEEGWLFGFEVFRGDSIQCVSGNEEEVLRAAIMIRAWLKAYVTPDSRNGRKQPAAGRVSAKGYFSGKLDMRVSVGVGNVEFYKSSSLAHSDGEAFRLSGQGLDQIKSQPYRMIVQTPRPELNAVLEPSILLLDAVLEKWTINQAEIALFKLRKYKEDRIAAELRISQSAVSQRIKTSQWNAIDKLLIWFEKTIKDIQA